MTCSLQRLPRQYLYFCTSKASKLSTDNNMQRRERAGDLALKQRVREASGVCISTPLLHNILGDAMKKDAASQLAYTALHPCREKKNAASQLVNFCLYDLAPLTLLNPPCRPTRA
jgi:hypothetical protein